MQTGENQISPPNPGLEGRSKHWAAINLAFTRLAACRTNTSDVVVPVLVTDYLPGAAVGLTSLPAQYTLVRFSRPAPDQPWRAYRVEPPGERSFAVKPPVTGEEEISLPPV